MTSKQGKAAKVQRGANFSNWQIIFEGRRSRRIISITKDEDYLQNIHKQAKVHDLEKHIDPFVYKLYGLTEEEIKSVKANDRNG